MNIIINCQWSNWRFFFKINMWNWKTNKYHYRRNKNFKNSLTFISRMKNNLLMNSFKKLFTEYPKIASFETIVIYHFILMMSKLVPIINLTICLSSINFILFSDFKENLFKRTNRYRIVFYSHIGLNWLLIKLFKKYGKLCLYFSWQLEN